MARSPTILEGTTKAMKITYILDALLDSLDLLESCSFCTFKDKTRIKKALVYAEELAALDKKCCELNGDI